MNQTNQNEKFLKLQTPPIGESVTVPYMAIETLSLNALGLYAYISSRSKRDWMGNPDSIATEKQARKFDVRKAQEELIAKGWLA